MLEQIHSAHLGAERCIRAARDSLYWPTFNNDIKYLCDNCEVCQEHKPDQTKQPMQSQPIPKRRWQYVSTDLFSVKNDTYVVVVDNLTKYWDIEELEETSAQNTVLQTKKIFSRHGVPEFVISDNGPQYTRNGVAEAAVKQAKRILKMSSDPWLAVLEMRNTPDELASPNEKLMSRRTRTTLPIKPELLEPVIISTKTIVKATVKKKQQNKRYYDKVSKPLPPLVVGENIRTKIKPSSHPWSSGTVVGKHNDRSYIVEANGKQYRRDRLHIRKGCELVIPRSNSPTHSAGYDILPRQVIPSRKVLTSPQRVEPEDIEISTSCDKQSKSPTKPLNSTHEPLNVPDPQTSSTTLRRSGRVRKPNPKYKDFVLD
ncbi:uncharacterized protein K02A2.6-like [Dendronephthya gigantea]|uniref:uncharacterized protein K02A2.6-like n=1 Tax=Dendronephthya gigantea TaxID=151771 RepID=UPI00106BC7BA|nr:uncharacterized protein K02A2.6-like [Dendronephthya gigantea]